MTIIKGTTPTITYTFETVSVDSIATAIMTIKSGGTVVLTKDLTDATVGQKTLSWTLTQAESLSVSGDAKAMLNWVLSDGTRGASHEAILTFTNNHINEVI